MYNCLGCGTPQPGASETKLCPACNPPAELRPIGTGELALCTCGTRFNAPASDPSPECPSCGQRVFRSVRTSPTARPPARPPVASSASYGPAFYQAPAAAEPDPHCLVCIAWERTPFAKDLSSPAKASDVHSALVMGVVLGACDGHTLVQVTACPVHGQQFDSLRREIAKAVRGEFGQLTIGEASAAG